MPPQVFWINVAAEGRLAILARPRADEWPEDEIAGWEAEGLQTVLCLLERDEVDDLALQHEARLAASARQHARNDLPAVPPVDAEIGVRSQ